VAKRKKPDAPSPTGGHPRTPVQGTLFGPADAYGGHAEPAPVPPPVAPEPSRWDEGLTPPTPDELAALRAAHPGVLLLFRHKGGCAFHGDDTPVALGLLSMSPGGPPDRPWAGWPHGDFERHMRRLLCAGHSVCVVERGEGLPPGHRLGADPVVTPFTEVPAEEATADA
jgi:hypothetical protein